MTTIQESLIKPLVTEKTSMLREKGVYVFKVAPKATKVDVERAVEALFSVKVKKVRMLNYRPQKKQMRMRRGGVMKLSGHKRAYVCLTAGQTIKELQL